ncbi:MAG TPA: DEAD/DEAH box helicase [Kofleriaceae bacterium]
MTSDAASHDVLHAFHPLIAGWFRERFGAPTDPQVAGWPRIAAGEDVLIAAPTGSGKTLAAFLACLDALLVRALREPLADETEILYISPLKALSNDVHRNLEAPLAELTAYAAARGTIIPPIRIAVRTGDTPASERAKLAKRPAHILVTTPESLFILLTTEKGRAALGRVRTVIVDEIHAIAGDKRGAHLALSLERLDRLVTQVRGVAPIRVGLSATQRPIERIARLLVGTRRPLPHIVDGGHRRTIDLAIEITDDELGAVASNEQFGRLYDRVASLVQQHRSTIVFVNTRRLVERVAAAMEQRLGEEHVVAHHGSMSRLLRHNAEQKLKYGQVKCAIATTSLELGIDVGTVDLVVQIGSPRSHATLLQRVGRSGHSLGATPKGRLFALTRDQLVECAALVRGVRRGNLDEIVLRVAPLDILAQQIVAICAAEEIAEVDLAALVRGATCYADLSEAQFEQVLGMLAEGVSDRRGRAGAHVHRDRVAGLLRGRRGARLAAITCGGAIPDNNNYAVIAWPEEQKVGELDEDFAIESSAGDIFQLGNTAWRVKRVEAGKVIVEDAHGQPPTIPFWLGEAPARTRELSDEVSDLRREIDERITLGEDPVRTAAWLAESAAMPLVAAQQLVAYLAAGRAALGALPRKDLLVAERFFDEAGGMQLVIHAPLGGRVNRAWGLALRKKFCRSFDFELQASATDDGIVISLGQPHSFSLDTVFGFVPAAQAEAVLVQALLDRPMFEIRWRWNVTRSLTVLRRKGGTRVAPHLVKMRAADTLSVVFPQAQACPENLPGDREIPDHPLVFETIRDCLVEAMDIDGLRTLIERLERGEIQVMARDTVEPSPLSHELLNANPYAFLDDAPLEERRTRAVTLRRGLPADTVEAVGTLDPDAIAAAAAEVAPVVRDVDELHDALLALWLVPEAMGATLAPDARDWFAALAGSGRAVRISRNDHSAWVATERLGAARAMLGEDVACEPSIATPAWAARPEREAAILRVVGAHLDHGGPCTARSCADRLGFDPTEVLVALLALESDGAILRGTFTPGAPISSGGGRVPTTARDAIVAADDTARLFDVEWCNRRVLARIHRLTLARLRREIEPVGAAALMRFLLRWQRVSRHTQLIGADGLARIVEQLQGFETAAGAWERELLPARLCGYDASWLDQLCLAGAVVWCRLSPRKTTEPEPVDAAPEVVPATPATPANGNVRVPARIARRASGAPQHPSALYDLAEAGAEAARIAGGSRDDIMAAALAPLAGQLPAHEARVLAALVTRSAMLRRDGSDDLGAAALGSDRSVGAALGPDGAALGPDGAALGPDGAALGPAALGPAALGPDASGPDAAVRRDAATIAPRRLVAGPDPGSTDDDERRGSVVGRIGRSSFEQRAARARSHLPPPPIAPASPRPDAPSPTDVAAPPLSSGASHSAASTRADAIAPPSMSSLFASRSTAPTRTDAAMPPSSRVAPHSADAASPLVAPGTAASRAASRSSDAAAGASNADAAGAGAGGGARANRSAPSRSAPLALMMRADAGWLRAAAATTLAESPALSSQATTVRDQLARAGASFLADLVAAVPLPPDEVEDALWELVGAGLATADGFASLRVLVDRRRGEVKSLFDRVRATAVAAPAVRTWQDAIRKARTRDRERPTHALRSLPTAAGRWSLLPGLSAALAADLDCEASARQLLARYGVVFRDLVARESSLPPWRDLLVSLRRLEARGEIRGGRFVNGFVGEQFALPEALDELRAVRNPGIGAEPCRVAATDPLNLVGILSAGPRVPAVVGNAVLYLDGVAIASLEAGEVVVRSPLPPGARVDSDLTYHPPPRPPEVAAQAALPL